MTTAQLDRRGATFAVALLASLGILLAPGSLPQLELGGGGHARPLQGAAALAQAKQTGIDIGGIIETVDHHVSPVGGRPGLLSAQDRLYRAQFGPAGFAFSLRARLSARAEAIPFQARPALRIETSAISRGGKPLPLSPRSWRSQRNVAQRSLAAGLSERVSARRGRLEWDFVLPRPLPGAGGLRIQAKIRTAGVARRVRHGWRWSLSRGRHLRLGELRVRDARGQELYRALPRVSRGQVVLDVPADVLEDASYPLTLDPVISPEYPVSEPVAGAAGGLSQALAFDGTNYLVVWVGECASICGARVTPAGTLLDPTGIAISPPGGHQNAPALAFDGTNYLVVWRDPSSGCCSIGGARVSPAGTVLDPTGIAISAVPQANDSPALDFDGTNYLVVWVDTRSVPAVRGARVSPAGSVLDPNGITISTAPGIQTPALAFDGTNYLVVWEDSSSGCCRIHGARVSPAGSVLDPGGIPIGGGLPAMQFKPAVAFDGTNYLVVWEGGGGGCGYVCGTRVSPAGTVLDAGGITISNTGRGLALAFDGTNYLVVWSNAVISRRDHVYGARVSTAGIVLDPAGIAISTGLGSQPALAFDGTNYLVAWAARESDRSIYGARVSPAGSVVDPAGIRLSTAAVNSQGSPALAFDGTNYLVVWSDTRLGADLYGARVSQAGALLDRGGIAISTAPESQGSPALAFDGTNYLVVWEDRRASRAEADVYGARVSPAGSVLDPDGIPITSSIFCRCGPQPAVAFDGTNYLVVWFNGGLSRRTHAIEGVRVTQAGSVLDPAPFGISPTGGDEAPALTFDGTNYLVTWAHVQGILDLPSGIYGARVGPTGNVLDPAGIAISTADGDHPALAFDGTNYLVTWEDLRPGYPNSDIYGARVSTGGTVLDPAGIAITTANDRQVTPAVAFEGRDYLVAWGDNSSGTSSDIFAARVNPDGEVLDPAGLGIATSASDETAPALAVPRPGRIAVGYERVAPEAPYDGASRVFLRFLDTRPANDDWANAEAIGAGSSPRSGTTLDATGEPGEPDHARSAAPLNSVWYAFTLPRTAVVRLDTCGSGFDTVLAVYTGTRVDALTQVRANRNGCGHQSRINFRAQAGVRYTVALDGAGSATGPFTLTFTERRELPTRRRPGA